MTDREKLIELMKEPIHPRVGADPAEVVADYLLDNGVTFATDTNAWSKWIRVEDRLPEESDADAVGRVWAKLRTEQPREWHWTLVVDYPEEFTHWIPLPSTEGLE